MENKKILIIGIIVIFIIGIVLVIRNPLYNMSKLEYLNKNKIYVNE